MRLWLAAGAALCLATAARGEIGVSVNGTDVSAKSGEGWRCGNGTNVVLAGPGPFLLTGASYYVAFSASNDCSVTFSNLLLRAKVSIGPEFDCGTQTVSLALAGTNVLVPRNEVSNPRACGIRVGPDAAITIYGDGYLCVTGMQQAAAIGSTKHEPCGAITINGGRLDASSSYAGSGAAVIGGGYAQPGGRIWIAGGSVNACCAENGGAPAIGGGHDEKAGDILISGGTVIADGHGSWGCDIGQGYSADSLGKGLTNRVVITGGNVFPVHGNILPAPSNGTARVYESAITNVPAGAVGPLRGNLSSWGYGANDVWPAPNGNVYAWLPDGKYGFSLGGRGYVMTVNGTNGVCSRARGTLIRLGGGGGE
jgi:hypothetical protein